MTQQDFSLAKVFADLAGDPTWPWIFISQEKSIIKVHGNELNGNDYLGGRMYDPKRTRFVAQSPLTMARLALMVVEETAKRHGKCSGWMETSSGAASKMKDIFEALIEWGINPDHYAKVKERVELEIGE